MRLRSIHTDGLTLSLPQSQMVDDGGSEQKHEDKGRNHCPAGAEGNVSQDIERTDHVRECREQIKHGSAVQARSSDGKEAHGARRLSSALTTAPMREPSDPFTITISPGSIAASTCSASSV